MQSPLWCYVTAAAAALLAFSQMGCVGVCLKPIPNFAAAVAQLQAQMPTQLLCFVVALQLQVVAVLHCKGL
jgi:hypothetical protein